jgi:SurA N-terminal domain
MIMDKYLSAHFDRVAIALKIEYSWKRSIMTMRSFFRRSCRNMKAGLGRSDYTTALIAIGLFLMAVLTGCASAGGPRGKDSPQAVGHGAKDTANDDSELAARVNGVAITRTAVKAMAARMAGGGDADATSKEALDRLIVAELAYERAKEVGLTLAPADIDDAVKDIKDNVGGEDMFQRTLAEKKMSEEGLRRELGRDLLIRQIIQKEVLAGIVIDSAELNREIEKTREELIMQGEKAATRSIRRSVMKKLNAREEQKRLAAWEAGLRKRARIEILGAGDEKK